ncbi:hypothetical protein TIFTF001_017965 [Ficus carica]|uniref:Uncharacterized protein n=1 Tax=Ficus carica TaxID=3494 RepID=A0AA88DJ48_FICCA|nr:hypothetical protein TIFTF001_017965 [Ficus carica]
MLAFFSSFVQRHSLPDLQAYQTKRISYSEQPVISMATRAVSLAKELKSVTQERCFLLEVNRRLREGFSKGIRPEEDEPASIAGTAGRESRLANENPNLVRENQCFNQLVQYYHQLTSQEDFPNVLKTSHLRCLAIPEDDATDEDYSNGNAAAKCF